MLQYYLLLIKENILYRVGKTQLGNLWSLQGEGHSTFCIYCVIEFGPSCISNYWLKDKITIFKINVTIFSITIDIEWYNYSY